MERALEPEREEAQVSKADGNWLPHFGEDCLDFFICRMGNTTTYPRLPPRDNEMCFGNKKNTSYWLTKQKLFRK